jgi:amino acid permease
MINDKILHFLISGAIGSVLCYYMNKRGIPYAGIMSLMLVLIIGGIKEATDDVFNQYDMLANFFGGAVGILIGGKR